MKVFTKIFITVLTILFVNAAYSQTLIQIADDAAPEANLTAALVFANAGNDVIIELTTDGGVYKLFDSDSITTNVTIRAQEGLAVKPTIIPGDTVDNFFEINQNILTETITLTLQGIKFDGRFEDGSLNPFSDDDFIAVVRNDEADRTILPNVIVENCDFSNSYENASPETDNKGSFFRIRDFGTAGTVRFENCTFQNNADEPILMQKARDRAGVERTADSLIIRNCTFINCGLGPNCQALITVKGDTDAETPDVNILIENLTVFRSHPKLTRIDDNDNTILRNVMIVSPDTTDKDSKLIALQKASSSLSHINVFDVIDALVLPDTTDLWGYILNNAFEIAPGRDTGGDPGVVDTATIYNMDPLFADAENGDLTVGNAALYSLASDGGLIGDLRWADPAITSIIDHSRLSNVPQAFALSQNYPNPFNPLTTIRYSLQKNSEISITVYNITGKLVETLYKGNQNAGEYSVTWDASNLASGVYFYKLHSGTNSVTRKMMLIK